MTELFPDAVKPHEVEIGHGEEQSDNEAWKSKMMD
jgi:hypothetical protein